MTKPEYLSPADSNGGNSIHLLPLLLIFLGLSITYVQVFKYPYFVSEYGQFYHWNNSLDFAGWLENFNPLRPGWYRPSAFILQFQIVAALIGWHDIFGFQCVTLLTMLALAVSVYFLTWSIIKDTRVAALAGLASAIHPVMYMLPVDLIYFDGLYQIAVIWSAYFFIRSLHSKPVSSLLWASVLFVFSLTLKEQSFVLPGAFVIIMALRIWIFDEKRNWRQYKAQINTTFVLCAIGMAYAITRMLCYGSCGGHYRTSTDWAEILPNLLVGSLWIFRLFPWGSPTWYGISRDHWASPDGELFSLLRERLFHAHDMWHPLSAILGIGIVFICIWGTHELWRTGDRRKRWILACLWLNIPVFMFLPVYSGGHHWHFAIPAFIVMIILSWSMAHVFGKVSRRSATLVMTAMGILLVCISIYDFCKVREMRSYINHPNVAALQHPPVPAENIPPNAHIYYAVDTQSWIFGNGYLFEWAYLRPDVRDVQLFSISGSLTEEDKCIIRSGQGFLFDYDSHTRTWRDLSSMFTSNNAEGGSNLTNIDFKSGGNSVLYRTAGWSGQERDGIWTMDNIATVKLPELSGETSTLMIWAFPFLFPEHPAQELDISINGHSLGRFDYKYGQDFANPLSLSIPADYIVDGMQELVLKIDNPGCPASIGPSTDTRMLGFFVTRITLSHDAVHD